MQTASQIALLMQKGTIFSSRIYGIIAATHMQSRVRKADQIRMGYKYLDLTSLFSILSLDWGVVELKQTKIARARRGAAPSYIFSHLGALALIIAWCFPFTTLRAEQDIAEADAQSDNSLAAPPPEKLAINNSLLESENTADSSASTIESAPEAAITPRQIEQAEPQQVIIPRGTVVKTFLDEEMSSKTTRPGDEFSVTVAEDIMVEDKIAIPAGSKGFGVVMFANGRGAFGRAGLLDIKVDVIEVGEYDVPVRGRFRQQGKGNSGAMVAAWAAVGVFSGFITGKSGVMPQGQELKTKILSEVEIPVYNRPSEKAIASETIPSQQPLGRSDKSENTGIGSIEGESEDIENSAESSDLKPETGSSDKKIIGTLNSPAPQRDSETASRQDAEPLN